MNFNRSWPNQDDYFMEPNDDSWDVKEIADILSSKNHFFSDDSNDSDDSNKKSKRLDARDYIIHHYNEDKLEPIFVAEKNGNDSNYVEIDKFRKEIAPPPIPEVHQIPMAQQPRRGRPRRSRDPSPPPPPKRGRQSRKNLNQYQIRIKHRHINEHMEEFVDTLPKEWDDGVPLSKIRDKLENYFSYEISNNGIGKLSNFHNFFYRKQKRDGDQFYYIYCRKT
ncbi:hypothetical protein M9Y10_030461 [Tritrichomonas musculus]|uniref:Uncharacterized protein n=1 Tax=Tritrichomonas musculus TaxID=1915356 RepID=A0ABR2H383_9EUKA